MNYNEKVALEIANYLKLDTAAQNFLEKQINCIIRDVRHKIAENLILDGKEIAMEAAHSIVMNTNLD